MGITQVGDDFAVRVNLKEPPRDAFEVPSTVDGVVVVTEVVGPIAKRR